MVDWALGQCVKNNHELDSIKEKCKICTKNKRWDFLLRGLLTLTTFSTIRTKQIITSSVVIPNLMTMGELLKSFVTPGEPLLTFLLQRNLVYQEVNNSIMLGPSIILAKIC